MIRVLRIINRFNLGGPTYNVAFLSKFLNSDFETLLIGGEKEASEESSSYIVHKLSLNPTYISSMHREINWKQDRLAYKEIKAIIREFKPHIVHTHASKSGALGRLAAVSERVPIIVHTFHGHVFHSYFGSLKTTIFKVIERYLAKKSDAIVVLSKEQQREIAETFRICPIEKTKIIPLGFDLTKFTEDKAAKRKLFREKYGITEQVVVGIIGRVVPIKNHSMFLKGMAHQKSELTTKKALGIIIGDGESKDSMLEEANELGLQVSFNQVNSETTDILFLSWKKEIYNILPGLDIVALTSKNEGTPVSLIEAQAAGLPVISTKVGGVENIVADGVSGYLVSAKDQTEFNEKLLRLISSEDLRNTFKDANIEHTLRQSSYHRLVSDMENLYYELAKQKRITETTQKV